MSLGRTFAIIAVLAGGLAVLKAMSAADGLARVAFLEAPALAADAADDAADAQDEDPATSADTPATAAPAPEPTTCPAPDLASRAGLSQNEIQVLRNLAQRRREIDAREREFETRALLLETAEARIEERVETLKTLQSSIETLLGQLDEREEAEVSRLVAMYERMKPGDAAMILPLLDEDVRIQVAARMKEQSLAEILADMTNTEAAALTMLLARRYAEVEAAGEAVAADFAEATDG